MAIIQIKKGDELPMALSFEFEGTIRNHVIMIENQYILTKNNSIKNHLIKFDGNPLNVEAKFIGVKGSKIKKFTITINEKTEILLEDVVLKAEQLKLERPIPYQKFDLEESTNQAHIENTEIAKK